MKALARRGTKKPNANAVLKTLPFERQEAIALWCDKPNERTAAGKSIPGTGGLAYAWKRLKEEGIEVGLSTLSNFHRWWLRKMHFEELLEWAKYQEKKMKEFKPGDLQNARRWGEFAIIQRANLDENPQTFKIAASTQDSRRKIELQAESVQDRRREQAEVLAIAREKLELDRDRFEFDGAQAVLDELPALKEIAQDSGLSLEEKIAQIRVRLWGPPPPDLAHLDWKPEDNQPTAQ